MFTVSRTIDINDPSNSATPDLNRAQVWRGLEMKAENPLPFVHAMESCTVTERGEDWLVRDIRLRGEDMTERVTFAPQERVTFERTKSTAMGTILNEIVEGPGGALQLKFTFSLEVDGMEPGSDAEKAFSEEMADSYLMAVNTTLDHIRTLVQDGDLAA